MGNIAYLDSLSMVGHSPEASIFSTKVLQLADQLQNSNTETPLTSSPNGWISL